MNIQKIRRAIEEKGLFMVKSIGDHCPESARDKRYNDVAIDWWTSGFWPGILWILYDLTGNEKFRDGAWSWDERLGNLLLSSQEFHHDVGFQFLPTAVMKFKLTGDVDAYRRGMVAAGLLASRYNPQGEFIVAWNGKENTGRAIIDCCMNLSLLFWASEMLGDPRFSHVACKHLDTALKYSIRGDGSVRHIIEFDPISGQFLRPLGGQGLSENSAWSRGQAWALYGMINGWRYTGSSEYLDASKRVANFFLASLPEDSVPYWDFKLPSLKNEPRDTSAGAIAASGLIELSRALPEADGRMYADGALKILQSLTDNYSNLSDPDNDAILRSATGSKPVGANVNVPLIYGDYFYVEAIAKLSGWKHFIF